MQARDILDEMKKNSFQGLNDDELDRSLEAGTRFALKASSLLRVEDMKLAVRYVTDRIHILDSTGNKLEQIRQRRGLILVWEWFFPLLVEFNVKKFMKQYFGF